MFSQPDAGGVGLMGDSGHSLHLSTMLCRNVPSKMGTEKEERKGLHKICRHLTVGTEVTFVLFIHIPEVSNIHGRLGIVIFHCTQEEEMK